MDFSKLLLSLKVGPNMHHWEFLARFSNDFLLWDSWVQGKHGGLIRTSMDKLSPSMDLGAALTLFQSAVSQSSVGSSWKVKRRWWRCLLRGSTHIRGQKWHIRKFIGSPRFTFANSPTQSTHWGWGVCPSGRDKLGREAERTKWSRVCAYVCCYAC